MATEKRLIDANDVYALFGQNGMARLHVADIDVIPTIDAVEVARLGKLGRLMMPYKGCPRGRMGKSADGSIAELDPIKDVEGDTWIPVLKEDLDRLKAKSVEVVHGRWSPVTYGLGVCVTRWMCSNCKKYENVPARTAYCPNCGAKMDGDVDAID